MRIWPRRMRGNHSLFNARRGDVPEKLNNSGVIQFFRNVPHSTMNSVSIIDAIVDLSLFFLLAL